MSNPMQPGRILPVSRTALQDSNNGSPSTKGKYSPVASASVNGVPPSLFWANTLVSGLAIAFGCWAIFQATLAEREARMLQYYVLEMDAKLIAAGVKKPEESVASQQEKHR